jgi:hypothetical protein
MVSLVCLSCSWLVLAPKVFQLCTNHFVLVLCSSMRMSEACHFFLVPSRSSNTPLYPSIVLRAKEWDSTPCSSVVFNLGLTFESLKELGVRHWRTHHFPHLEHLDGVLQFNHCQFFPFDLNILLLHLNYSK